MRRTASPRGYAGRNRSGRVRVWQPAPEPAARRKPQGKEKIMKSAKLASVTGIAKAPVVQAILEMKDNWAKRCQAPGRLASSHSRYRALCGLFVLLIAIAGCGSGASGIGFNPNNVTVSVSPPTAAILTNGQVPLQATVQGLSSGYISSISFWIVAENPPGAECATFVGIVPPGPCPAGTVQLADGSELTVTYFAPSTPGTYHLSAQWDYSPNFNGPPSVIKIGTSVITVSP